MADLYDGGISRRAAHHGLCAEAGREHELDRRDRGGIPRLARGLGYLIVYGGQVFRMDLVMGSTAVLCVCAALMYLLVAAMEKRLNRARAHGG